MFSSVQSPTAPDSADDWRRPLDIPTPTPQTRAVRSTSHANAYRHRTFHLRSRRLSYLPLRLRRQPAFPTPEFLRQHLRRHPQADAFRDSNADTTAVTEQSELRLRLPHRLLVTSEPTTVAIVENPTPESGDSDAIPNTKRLHPRRPLKSKRLRPQRRPLKSHTSETPTPVTTPASPTPTPIPSPTPTAQRDSSTISNEHTTSTATPSPTPSPTPTFTPTSTPTVTATPDPTELRPLPALLTASGDRIPIVRPSIVHIAVSEPVEIGPGVDPPGANLVGTGIVFDGSGHILTSNHLVGEC